MKTLRSYVYGTWHEADRDFQTLYDPCQGEAIAQASTSGVDFGRVLSHARDVGGPALRALSWQERGALLKQAAKVLHEARDELIELSLVNTGATRKDAKFDLDGATGTLSFYSYLASEFGERPHFAPDGEGAPLGRSAKFWGQHVWVPKHGVAVHINAFNFPAWGFAEKAACAILAGMPVVTKPATSTAYVTERCIELLIEAGVFPEGSFQFIAGSTGDLLSQLGSQDVLAFTGSADTALKLRGLENLLASSTTVNIEADSLNAAVLGPDLEEGDEAYQLFIREVAREMTQKSGQKCTAIRRIVVPAERLADARDALAAELEGVRVGDPRDSEVNMGPLATQQQLDDAVAGTKKLSAAAKIVFGTGERVDGIGSAAGQGYYFAPTILEATDSDAEVLHTHEVFGPVATLVSYDGSAERAAQIVSRSDGTLVNSVYSDDRAWVGTYLAAGGAYTGRLYLGSEKMAAQALGSGLALPQSLHGGPGRAGGGTELGGTRGVELYMQRVALQGSRFMIEKL